MMGETDDHVTMIDQEKWKTLMMGEIDVHVTMIDQLNKRPLLLPPRNRGTIRTKTANRTGNVQVNDGHREVVAKAETAKSIAKRMEKVAETIVVKITTVPEEMAETEIAIVMVEKGKLSARTKVGIEVNAS
jgi:hypothetical protein